MFHSQQNEQLAAAMSRDNLFIHLELEQDQDYQSNSNQNMSDSPTMARAITYNKGTLCVMKFGSSEMCALV